MAICILNQKVPFLAKLFGKNICYPSLITTWGQCYDFKYITKKYLAILLQIMLILSKNWIITSKKSPFFAKNLRKFLEIVIITLTPDFVSRVNTTTKKKCRLWWRQRCWRRRGGRRRRRTSWRPP
jgi:hypothetical protein